MRVEVRQLRILAVGVEVGAALPFDQDQRLAGLDLAFDRVGELPHGDHLAAMLCDRRGGAPRVGEVLVAVGDVEEVQRVDRTVRHGPIIAFKRRCQWPDTASMDQRDLAGNDGPGSTRRQFLRVGGGGVLAVAAGSQLAWLAGCGSGEESTVGAAPDWDGLRKELRGQVLTPGAKGFEARTTPYNLRYADLSPQGVAVCADADDVRRAVRFAAAEGLPVAVRSGGHNYAGYCSGPGLVVNLGSMREVAVSEAAGTVTAQPGARNTMIYAGLEPHGVAISAGRCPTVAVGGLVLGGGIGFSSRKLGLTCDHLVEAEVVTAAGELVRASERENADLFWALRGAGGGNFGVCTRYLFETRPVGHVSIYDVAFRWRDAEAVFAAFQDVIRSGPNEFSARVGVGAPGTPGGEPGAPEISILGQYFGPARELRELLAPVLRVGPTTKELIEDRTFWQAKDYFFDNVPSEAFAVKSAYLDEPLGDAGVAALLGAVGRWPGSSNSDGAGAALFASGGAINEVAPDATAFVHRRQFAILATESTWSAKDPEKVADANVGWLDDLAAALAPHVSGSAYQNFIDRSQPDWERAYYGGNLERLTKVKRRYDPDGLFAFEQGIPSGAT
jgi:FAD/FMN-containing dehydrogenase